MRIKLVVADKNPSRSREKLWIAHGDSDESRTSYSPGDDDPASSDCIRNNKKKIKSKTPVMIKIIAVTPILCHGLQP